MTNVSKNALKKEVTEKISNQFIRLISDYEKFNKSSNFVNEFFTKSERIMFAKRLAIIFLILEDLPQISISEALKVSPTTVNKIAVVLDRGGYQSTRKYFKDKKHRQSFWYQLEVILRAGMPPIAGRGRWARVYRILDKNKRM